MCLLSQLLSKVTIISCSFYIKCSMCPSCCWMTHSKNVLLQKSGSLFRIEKLRCTTWLVPKTVGELANSKADGEPVIGIDNDEYRGREDYGSISVKWKMDDFGLDLSEVNDKIAISATDRNVCLSVDIPWTYRGAQKVSHYHIIKNVLNRIKVC